MKEVKYVDENGKSMKFMVVDVPQVVANDFVATLEVSSGSLVVPVAAACRTTDNNEM